MIDIHTHILPGVDDGAGNLDEALAMARLAVADGVAQLVATPHSAWGAATEANVREGVRALQAALDEAGIPLHLATGVEFWLTPEVVAQQQAGRAFPINGGRYMLIELPPHQIPAYAEQSIFALQLAGVTPVLAHPERYSALEGNLKPMYDLVSRGVLGQVTAGSLLGEFGPQAKQMAEIMLTHRLAHVIASDAHSSRGRPPVLSAAAKRAAQLVGEEQGWAMVTTVPESIVAGRALEIPEPLPYRPKWHWLPWGG